MSPLQSLLDEVCLFTCIAGRLCDRDNIKSRVQVLRTHEPGQICPATMSILFDDVVVVVVVASCRKGRRELLALWTVTVLPV
jgi:hypothetical protein